MATIIRKDSPREVPSARAPQPVSFSFADMRGQANDYLGSVRAEAAKIVQEAHQQAEQIRRQAEVAGRKAAEAAAERVLDEKVGKRMQTLLPALERLVRELSDARGELLSHWQKSAVKVSSAIAERIIRRELAQTPEIAADIVNESLSLATGATEIVVRVNPNDHEFLGPHLAKVSAMLAQVGPNQFVPDEAVTPGGCIVNTKYGEIDARIETQLARIEEELT